MMLDLDIEYVRGRIARATDPVVIRRLRMELRVLLEIRAERIANGTY
jgi:hypothetical protein